MLKWCSYCQQFMGEVPEYEDLAISHGICPKCHPRALLFTESDFKHAEFLKDVHRQLLIAGRNGDLERAAEIIDNAAKANCRLVDVLIGIIAPMLYQIGEDWKAGILSVEGEHQFTSFCERTFDLVASKVKAGKPTDLVRSNEAEILLMNAPGNEHTLAIRILALWLVSKGKRAQIADAHLSLDELTTLVKATKPKVLLISMALAEQSKGVMAITERIAELPKPIRPRIIVGGYAVKLGLVPSIPGADLMADISVLT